MDDAYKTLTVLGPIPALWFLLGFINMFAKKTPFFPNWFIPWFSSIIGAMLFPFMSDKGIFRIPYPIIGQVVVGALLGFASVGTYEGFKNTVRRFGFQTGETEFVVRAKDVKSVNEATAELRQATAKMIENTEPLESEKKEL